MNETIQLLTELMSDHVWLAPLLRKKIEEICREILEQL